MTEHMVAFVTTTFPKDMLPEELLPEGTGLRIVSGVEELATGSPVSTVLLFAGNTSAAACPALQQLHRLRAQRAHFRLRPARVRSSS